MPAPLLSRMSAALVFLGCLAFAAAPPARADDSTFLELLKGDQILNGFGPSALLQEGHNVCEAKKQSGVSEAQAVSMVQTDLGLPNNASDAAFDIVDAASAAYGC